MNGQFFESFDGAKIYYHKTVRDKNKWLVFLHGFGGDLTAWNKERTFLTKLGISTIAMDLRGHGLSQRSNNKDFYKLENFTKDLSFLIEKEKITNSVIIGHCFGGMISISFNAQFPDYSKGLVLVDSSYKPPFISQNPVEKTLLKLTINLIARFMPDLKQSGHQDFDKFIGTSDLDFLRILSDISHTSLRSYLIICSNLVDLNSEQLLSKIIVPTLIIEGSNDSVFPPNIALHLKKRIKKSELEFIKDANHILVLNNPEDLNSSIESFIKKIGFI